jgi:2,4-dienoyl-CoA reductase-like NADH-dependent reductase (Old Yellow Enzyme family)
VIPNEESWRSSDTVKLAPLLAAHGVDLLDVSSGGNNSRQKFAFTRVASQAEFSQAVKESVAANGITVAGTDAPLLVSAVGGIKSGEIANEVLESGWADVTMVNGLDRFTPRQVMLTMSAIGWPVVPARAWASVEVCARARCFHL